MLLRHREVMMADELTGGMLALAGWVRPPLRSAVSEPPALRQVGARSVSGGSERLSRVSGGSSSILPFFHSHSIS